MFEPFLGGFGEKLGLGFAKTERRRREGEENERNEGIRVFFLFINALGRVDPKPGPFPLFLAV